MEPRQFEKSVESHGEVQASPTLQPERKRRFQIVKLEERIAPGGGNGNHSVPHEGGCGDFTRNHKCGP
jgi:hypothetical protein